MTRRGFASWVPRRKAPDPIPEGEPAPEPETGAEPGSASGPATAPAPVSAPTLVEVLTDDDRFLAQFDLGQERLTDIMNREDEVVAFRIDPEADRSSDAAASKEPVALDVLNILLAIAPPQHSDAARRLHRPRHWVEMKIGAHDVFGNIHIPAGAQPGGYLLRINPRFVPLTQAKILTGEQERRTDVVLVNVRAVETMKEIGRSPTDYAGQFTDEYPDYGDPGGSGAEVEEPEGALAPGPQSEPT